MTDHHEMFVYDINPDTGRFERRVAAEVVSESETVAQEGIRVVDERGLDYGGPKLNFERIAGAINAMYGTNFSTLDIPIIMNIIKLARLVESPQHRDSWVDLVGYALAAEIAADGELD